MFFASISFLRTKTSDNTYTVFSCKGSLFMLFFYLLHIQFCSLRMFILRPITLIPANCFVKVNWIERHLFLLKKCYLKIILIIFLNYLATYRRVLQNVPCDFTPKICFVRDILLKLQRKFKTVRKSALYNSIFM
jgi:hypothetical protein